MTKTKTKTKTLGKLVGEYSNALGRYGPDSDATNKIRRENAENREFQDYADALDRVKRHLGGPDAKKK